MEVLIHIKIIELFENLSFTYMWLTLNQNLKCEVDGKVFFLSQALKIDENKHKF